VPAKAGNFYFYFVKDAQSYIPENAETVVLSRDEYNELLSRDAHQQTEIQYLKHELEKLKRMIFGSKSERFIPIDSSQLNLELEGIEEKKEIESETQSITYTRNKSKNKEEAGHSRMPLPAHLPRVEHVIEPEENTAGAKKIGEEITEILEYKPGKLYVQRYIRPKYLLPEDKGIVIGQLPSLPIPRGNAGAGLLSHIIISKYVDHLPFYRQVQQFKRQGVVFAESTMNGWFSATCKLLSPLYDKLKNKILRSDYLMADETPIPVLTEDKPGATHKGYIWVYFDPLNRMALFDYRKSRSREGPTEILQNFRGKLQTDGYEAYTIFEKQNGITLLACMAHARRKFEEAKDNDKPRAEHILKLMQGLYAIERKARDAEMPHEERYELRQAESLPILKEMEIWMKDNIMKVLPKSSIGKAISYTLNLWPRLVRYADDGRCEIDNNLIENSIRPIALGRKNYLFAGSHEGAERTAMMYTFMSCCKINNIEPYAWLRDTLTRLPDTKISQIENLLPNSWTSHPSKERCTLQ
jgi:transposase